jgi:purine-nucleoside phosphorylase
LPTPHISAEKGEIARTVLMPGDPLRAKFISDTFLSDIEIFNTVRNNHGVTGTFEGKTISVMASGMGLASTGIYSYELFDYFDVENIIRVGSAGAYSARLKVEDVVLANAAWSENSFAKDFAGYTEDMFYPSPRINDALRNAAQDLGIEMHETITRSSDVFYAQEDPAAERPLWQVLADRGIECVEMESFALFAIAKFLGKNAGTILTISDSFVHNVSSTPKEREQGFTNMMEIALKGAITL